MVKRLEIKRVKNANYSNLKQETNNFKKPVICNLGESDISRVKELRNTLLNFEENYKSEIFNNNDNLKGLDDVTEYSRGEDSRGSKSYSTSFIFLTKDKVISPVGFASDTYTANIERITKFFFDTSFFEKRLADSSIFQKLLLFTGLRKGIFGKFKTANLSNIVNINTWYSHGGTNTFIHANHGLSNFFLQLEGRKRWWIASPYQKKEILLEVFQSDLTALNLDNALFKDLEYYDFELEAGEIFYLPANWLHGVIAPPGLNLSISFLFPMTIKEVFNNIVYWKSIGVPLNHTKKSSIKEDKSLADLNAEQSEVFNTIKFYLRKHQFSTREILNHEPEFVSGLYDIDKLNKAITGAE